jgi:hypothetical protein
MSRMISAVVQVAPWGWPLCRWALQSWAPAVDDIVIAYEVAGRAWNSPQEHDVDPYVALPGDAGARVRFLAYQLPEFYTAAETADYRRGWQLAARNAASWMIRPGAIMVALDCDMWCTDPHAFRAWLRSLPNDPHAVLRARIAYDVLAVRGDRALVARMREPWWIPIGAHRPGLYVSSGNMKAGKWHDSPIPIIHWRAVREVDTQRAFHGYLGDDFVAWRESLTGPTDTLPAGVTSDAARYVGVDEIPVAQLGCPIPEGV